MTITSTTRPTLAVHVVFHPESAEARKLARAIDLALNGRDPVTAKRSDITAHIAVPTFFLPEACDAARHFHPPRKPDAISDDAWTDRLWFAERNLVVVLSDEFLAAPPPAKQEGDPAHDWSTWVRRYCPFPGPTGVKRRSRMLPVQVSDEGWPLHEDYRGISFGRALPSTSAELRVRNLVRRVTQELCRLIAAEAPGESDDDPAPVRVFISHAKADLNEEPRVVDALLTALRGDQPVRSWVDSGQIQPGRDFRKAIHDGLADCSVLCIVTDHYSSRPWCRTETIVAKTLGRPMIAIDALGTRDLRASPYVGNIPVMRWGATDEPSRRAQATLAIDLLVAETLRRGHARLELEALRVGDSSLLTSQPEPLTMLGRHDGVVVHPDPPLPDEDAAVFPGVSFVTPSARYRGSRDLLMDWMLGLSVSESTDCETYGVTQRAMDDAYIELTRDLLLLGATLAYGGNLRLDGYTVALFDVVNGYHANASAARVRRVINYVGWPVKENTKLKAKYKFDAIFERSPRPVDPDLAAWPEDGFDFPTTVPELAAWARGMTALRQRLVADCQARVLLGGKVGPATNVATGAPWFASRMPGVLEEALFTVEAGQPLFLVGGWGGAARLVGELLRGEVPDAATWKYQSQSPLMKELHAGLGPGGAELYEKVVDTFHRAGVAGCNNALTIEENDELLTCRHTPRVIELIVTGLKRLKVEQT